MVEHRPEPGIDVPEVDRFEQQIAIDRDDSPDDGVDRVGEADEPIATADEGDRVEQAQLVPGDDEDYTHDG